MSHSSSTSTSAKATRSGPDRLYPWWTNPSEDMGTALWTNSKYKDFQIVIGDRVLRVDKCVLAARSPVFAAMMSSGLTETTLGQVVIQDFDYDTVESAIKFCYSECYDFEASVTCIWNLLTFGHKYDIKHLIDMCLLKISDSSEKYFNCEKKFLITSALQLGSKQITDSILYSFQTIKKRPAGLCNTYMALGDELLSQDDSFKDLKIICFGGTEFLVHKCIEFPVHKSILVLSSPVFAQMIEEMDTDTSASGRLIIDRIKPTVFESALEFLYTGYIPHENFKDNVNIIFALLEFAERFRIEQLVTSCLQKINNDKDNLDGEIIKKTCTETAFKFESKKIFDFILGIFGTRGFDPFNLEKASKESYWK